MRTILHLLITLLLYAPRVSGAVVEYTDKNEWIATAGAFSTITFTEYPANTIVTDQYANLGATFTDGIDVIFESNAFLNDNMGLNGAFNEIAIQFETPQYHVAVDFPGLVQFTLFRNGSTLYESSFFSDNLTGPFAGLVSDIAFDEVLIVDPGGGVFIDDLHFGPPIPGPGGIAVLGCGAIVVGLNRRRRA